MQPHDAPAHREQQEGRCNMWHGIETEDAPLQAILVVLRGAI